MWNFLQNYFKKKEWTNLPPWKSQYSVLNRVDAMDCLCESLINIIFMLTGFDGSPRALAKLSGTTEQGNSKDKVLKIANEFGLVPYNFWQTPDDFLWEEYYKEIPREILWQAKKIEIKLISPNLNKSPLWTILQFPNGQAHGVCQINNKEYFDSEEGAEVKPLNYMGAKIVYQTSLKVKFL